MLGGPLAGTAVAALEGALGLNKGAGPDAITQALQSATLTPEQISAVRVADQKHAEILGQQNIDLAKINADHEEAFAKVDADDRANARAREVAVKDNTPKILAYLVTTGFFAVLGYMLRYGTPQSGAEAFLVMLGALGTAWAGIMTYYYGSSAGSAAAHQAINKIAITK